MTRRSEEFGGVLAGALLVAVLHGLLMWLRPSTICSGSGEESQRTFVLWFSAVPVVGLALLLSRWWRRLQSMRERAVAVMAVFVVAVTFRALWVLAQGIPSRYCP